MQSTGSMKECVSLLDLLAFGVCKTVAKDRLVAEKSAAYRKYTHQMGATHLVSISCDFYPGKRSRAGILDPPNHSYEPGLVNFYF
jgi:hypothetical protein